MTADTIARLKITLCDTDPPIWRRIEVKTTTTLKALHPVIQAAMGWENEHLFQFEIGGHKVSGGRASLGDLAAEGIKRFSYLYDMGDSWEHDLRIEKLSPADPSTAYPRYVDGAGRCPPEDVGGIPGFYAFLDALADPNNADHDDRLEWYGGPFHEKDIDDDRIKAQLAKIAKRKKPKAVRPKSSN